MINRVSRLFLTSILVMSEYVYSNVLGNPLPDEPEPAKAVEALIKVFDHYPIVALGERHWNRTEHEFIASLIKHPDFPTKVNDIVVEFGNAKYQNIMDKYIAGEMVAQTELRQVWRNTIVTTMVWEAPIYERFFATIRAVNQNLPKAKKLRVLLGDPPIDWDAVKSVYDFTRFNNRDEHFARVVDKEVLSKRRKALLIAGTGHFIRCCQSKSIPDNVTLRIDKLRPGSLFVVAPHNGFEERNDELEMRLSSWPKPGLATIKNTWLGNLSPDLLYPSNESIEIKPDGTVVPVVPATSPYQGLKFQDIADAYLYLGPKASLNQDMLPPEVERDEDYKRELARRRKLQWPEK